MEFSRQEHWSGLSFPTPEDLPDLGIEPMSLASPALAGRFFTTSTTWEAPIYYYFSFVLEMNFSSVHSLSRNEFTGMNLSCTTISLVFIIQSFFLGSVQFSSVQFSRSVVSDSLRPHESQHSRPPCPSPSPGVHSDSRPSSQ